MSVSMVSHNKNHERFISNAVGLDAADEIENARPGEFENGIPVVVLLHVRARVARVVSIFVDFEHRVVVLRINKH